MLTGLQLVNVLVEKDTPLSALADEMPVYPQVLKNVRVVDKNKVISDRTVQETISQVEEKLGEEGRVLVRPSGTEPLVRIMVEAPTKEDCETHVQQVVEKVEHLFGMK